VPSALLHIGAQETRVGSAALLIGSARTAAAHFRHSPPSPFELENAIAAVEDEIARARVELPRSATVFTADAPIRDIALDCGVPSAPRMQLTREALEQAFQRLAAQSLRAAAPSPPDPAGNELAAVVLILRELMHHLDFPAIVIEP
jgi:hypothetical protein